MVSRKKWAIGGSVVLAPAIVWTGAMLALPMLGKAAFDDGSASSVTRYQWAANITPGFLEGWQAPFNLGTAQLAHDMTDDGVKNLELALERVREAERVNGQVTDTEGPECKVRRNLSLGYEAQGDAAGQSGGPLLQKAATTIRPCTTSKDNEDKRERQEKKREKLDNPNPSPSQNPSQDPNPSPSQNPSQDPNPSPSQNPSQDPSQSPSQDPSQSPSQDPSQSPSSSPSGGQNQSGSGSPSSSPSPLPGGGGSKEDELRTRNQQGVDDNRRYRGGDVYEPNW